MFIMNRRIALLLAILLGIVGVVTWVIWQPRQGLEKIRISPETTYWTEPLDEDGNVDFIAILNGMKSEGVTPENNAYVDLIRIHGANEFWVGEQRDTERQQRYFELLSIDPDGEYDNQFVRYPGNPQDYMFETRPWAEEEFLDAVKWLEENREYLEAWVEATRKPRCYCPVIRSGGQKFVMNYVEVGLKFFENRGLVYTAMMRALADNDVDQFLYYSLALRRAAALVVDSAVSAFDLRRAFTLEMVTFERQTQLVEAARLTESQWQAYRQQFFDESLNPFSQGIQGRDIEKIMRIEVLNMLQGFYYNSKKRLATTEKGRSEKEDDFSEKLARAEFDWNSLFEQANRSLDDFFEQVWIETETHGIGLCKFEERVIERFDELENLVFRETPMSKSVWERKLQEFVLIMGHASCAQAFSYMRKMEAYRELARLTLAVGHFRANCDKLPSRLEDLVPNYLSRIPIDPYSDREAPLGYRITPNGFAVTSVGQNGIDDGGAADEIQDDPLDIVFWVEFAK